jgi:ribonuclease Z
MPHMVLLGVGTAVPDVDRDTTHLAWVRDDGPLLIDCGGSSYQRLLRAGLDPLQLRGLLVTHGHADHIHGVPILLFQLAIAGFQGPLPIYGTARTLGLVERSVAAFELGPHQVAASYHPLEPGDAPPIGGRGWTVGTAETIHPWPALATRFERESDGAAIVYSADTEPCAAVAELARGARVLIHEATTPEPFEGHTTPRQAGEIAARSGVERLVLVHFSTRYTMSEERAAEEARAGGFTGAASVGHEGEVLSV